jgi:hypothetical protein
MNGLNLLETASIMKILKIFFLLFLLLIVFGGAYLAFTDVPLQQNTMAVPISTERFIK